MNELGSAAEPARMSSTPAVVSPEAFYALHRDEAVALATALTGRRDIGEDGLQADRPDVDPDSEVVMWFGAVYSSSCPIRLDDVIVDHERSLVHGEIVVPESPGACEADANPRAYAIAAVGAHCPRAGFCVRK